MKLPLLSVLALGALLAGCGAPTPPAATEAPAPAKEGHSSSDAPTEKIKVADYIGKPAPGFEFVFTDGDQRTNADFMDKVVLLDFWATWCVTCKAASPIMQKWHEAYGEKGLAVIGVNTFESPKPELEKNERILLSAEASTAYAKEHNYTFSFATYGDATAERWGIGGVPAFVLIGKTGNLLAFETNAKPETLEKLEGMIRAELGVQ